MGKIKGYFLFSNLDYHFSAYEVAVYGLSRPTQMPPFSKPYWKGWIKNVCRKWAEKLNQHSQLMCWNININMHYIDIIYIMHFILQCSKCCSPNLFVQLCAYKWSDGCCLHNPSGPHPAGQRDTVWSPRRWKLVQFTSGLFLFKNFVA